MRRRDGITGLGLVLFTVAFGAGCGSSETTSTEPVGRPSASDAGTDGAAAADGSVSEVCGNGKDDDGDGKIDEGCVVDGGVDSGGDGKADGGKCVRLTCASAGYECGVALDGCGGTLECGECNAGKTCGGGGPNRCGSSACVPTSCAQLGAVCGYVSNGCNNVTDCGSCSSGACGGAGIPNQCGVPNECVAGQQQACYPGPAATKNVGVCKAGVKVCLPSSVGTGGWGACGGAVVGQDSEVCGDSLDNDCNGTVDDGCACVLNSTEVCYTGPASAQGVGTCKAGSRKCVAGEGGKGTAWNECEGSVLPTAIDTCGDGVDNDCNGQVDDGCACSLGATQECYLGASGTKGVGICKAGEQTCVAGEGGKGTVWGDCVGSVAPDAKDSCGDSLDNDCNGTVDDQCLCVIEAVESCYTGPKATEGIGVCKAGTRSCVEGSGGVGSKWTACSGEVKPGASDNCGDGLDNDCNGTVDDKCACVIGSTQPCYTGPAGTQGIGICAAGSQKCVAGSGGVGSQWGTCTGSVVPKTTDTCGDSQDNDCNGTVDDSCLCTIGATESCYTGPENTVGVGICKAGSHKCVAGSGGKGSLWGTCTGQTVPALTENCSNYLDDTCDGVINEGCALHCATDFDVSGDGLATGVCTSGNTIQALCLRQDLTPNGAPETVFNNDSLGVNGWPMVARSKKADVTAVLGNIAVSGGASTQSSVLVFVDKNCKPTSVAPIKIPVVEVQRGFAIDDNGTVALAIHEPDGVHLRVYASDGTLKTDSLVGVGLAAEAAQVAVNPSTGAGVISAHENAGAAKGRVYFRRFSSSGEWLDAQPVVVKGTETASLIWGHWLSMNRSGDFMVHWGAINYNIEQNLASELYSSAGTLIASKLVPSSSSGSSLNWTHFKSPTVDNDFLVFWYKTVTGSERPGGGYFNSYRRITPEGASKGDGSYGIGTLGQGLVGENLIGMVLDSNNHVYLMSGGLIQRDLITIVP